MGINFVWVKGLFCEKGHVLEPQSKARHDYRGYMPNAVPLDVATDLRDTPFACLRCDWSHLAYRLKFIGEPRSVCECCGKPSACSCYQVVAVEVERVPPWPNPLTWLRFDGIDYLVECCVKDFTEVRTEVRGVGDHLYGFIPSELPKWQYIGDGIWFDGRDFRYNSHEVK